MAQLVLVSDLQNTVGTPFENFDAVLLQNTLVNMYHRSPEVADIITGYIGGNIPLEIRFVESTNNGTAQTQPFELDGQPYKVVIAIPKSALLEMGYKDELDVVRQVSLERLLAHELYHASNRLETWTSGGTEEDARAFENYIMTYRYWDYDEPERVFGVTVRDFTYASPLVHDPVDHHPERTQINT